MEDDVYGVRCLPKRICPTHVQGSKQKGLRSALKLMKPPREVKPTRVRLGCTASSDVVSWMAESDVVSWMAESDVVSSPEVGWMVGR